MAKHSETPPKLPRRPSGNASLKAEIKAAPKVDTVEILPVPVVRGQRQ